MAEWIGLNLGWSEMLTRLVKSIVNTSNNTLAIGTADTNITNTVLKRIANTNAYTCLLYTSDAADE